MAMSRRQGVVIRLLLAHPHCNGKISQSSLPHKVFTNGASKCEVPDNCTVVETWDFEDIFWTLTPCGLYVDTSVLDEWVDAVLNSETLVSTYWATRRYYADGHYRQLYKNSIWNGLWWMLNHKIDKITSCIPATDENVIRDLGTREHYTSSSF